MVVPVLLALFHHQLPEFARVLTFPMVGAVAPDRDCVPFAGMKVTEK